MRISVGSVLLSLVGMALLAGPSQAASPAVQQWELVRPDGIVITDPIKINPHPSTLDGKNVVLRWSGKPNGDIMMKYVGDLIKRDFPKANVIVSWEGQPKESLLAAGWSASRDKSAKMASAILDLKPDLIVGGQGD